MALTAAQAAGKSPPAAGMVCLFVMGLALRAMAFGRAPGSHEAATFAALGTPWLYTALGSLHFDGHLSFYGMLAYGARAMGAGLTALRGLSCAADAALGLVWMLWLRGHANRAAMVSTGLWATAPLFLHNAVSVGPHAALALCTGLGWIALWPVWQKARPSRREKDMLTTAWAILIFAHPLGIVVVLSMVFTAVLWPHASAAALANSLTTGVGQAGRLAHNLGRPACVAGALYAILACLDHFYLSPEVLTPPLPFTFGALVQVLADLQGMRPILHLGPMTVHVAGLAWLGVGLTAAWLLAAWSHPIGRKLATTAVLYGMGLAAYTLYRPMFSASTLVPTWTLLTPGAALGLAHARLHRTISLVLILLVLWQAALWLSQTNSAFEPQPASLSVRGAEQKKLP